MKTSRLRFFALAAAVLLMAGLCGIRLFQLQVVDGESYLASAGSTTSSQVQVNAARGQIVDRYGNILVTNKAGFNLVFDRAFLKEETENDTILSLTEILKEAGEEWVDDLPVSQSSPYYFLPGKENEVSRMKEKLGMQSYATAEDCMTEIITRFELEDYGEKDLRTIAGVRYGMLAGDFSIYNRYTFAEDVSPDTVAAIEEVSFRYPGVSVSAESIRDYSGDGDFIPHIVGSMSAIFPDEVEEYLSKGYALNDRVGRDGIEGVMESELRGSAGTLTVEQNSKGEVVSTTMTKDPVAGNTVRLTIDMEFQKRVSTILEEFILDLQKKGGLGRDATSGAIVVLDTASGEVLAAATYPTYKISDMSDPELSAEIVNNELKPLVNRAFWDIYRPGSTFKTVTATAALFEGEIDKDSTVHCGGTYMFDSAADGYHPTCTGVHSNIKVVEALKVSCNIFFYDVGRRIGIDNIVRYAGCLGLGEDVGLEIRNAKGQIASPALVESYGSVWYPGNTWQAAIGQSETKITPLQMAVQAMTLANKGTRYNAHIIKSVDSYDCSETLRETEIKVLNDELAGNEELFDIVQEGMRAAADRRASMINIENGVAIKTGTPQVTKTQTNSTVIGFYPARTTPEISFAAVIEGGEYSADMMAQVINVYNDLKAERAGLKPPPADPEDENKNSSPEE